jgi:DNA (cytosine-5)-methyltransferase 1
MQARRFSQFVGILRSLGYFCNWDILDAANYGVPQRRRRLILLAHRINSPSFAPQAKSLRTVREAIGGLPPPSKSRDPLHNVARSHSEKIQQLIRSIPLNGGSRLALSRAAALRCHMKVDGFYDVYGRMKWDEVAPTITGGCINPSKGRFLHPRQHRAITLREAALLQTFPKDYKLSLSKGIYAAAEMIGNALPPEFIRRHASAVKKVLLNAS